MNEWPVDPGVHDALAADRMKQFESLFHMSPEEMDEHAAHEQASKNLFGNTMDFDGEIEELLMFNCLHDDDCNDIDLHSCMKCTLMLTTVCLLQHPKCFESMHSS